MRVLCARDRTQVSGSWLSLNRRGAYISLFVRSLLRSLRPRAPNCYSDLIVSYVKPMLGGAIIHRRPRHSEPMALKIHPCAKPVCTINKPKSSWLGICLNSCTDVFTVDGRTFTNSQLVAAPAECVSRQVHFPSTSEF